MTTNQHISDAAASLTARLIDEFGIDAPTATTFGKHFIEVMLANGWAPHRVIEPRGSDRAATPEQVQRHLAEFRSTRPKENS